MREDGWRNQTSSQLVHGAAAASLEGKADVEVGMKMESDGTPPDGGAERHGTTVSRRRAVTGKQPR